MNGGTWEKRGGSLLPLISSVALWRDLKNPNGEEICFPPMMTYIRRCRSLRWLKVSPFKAWYSGKNPYILKLTVPSLVWRRVYGPKTPRTDHAYLSNTWGPEIVLYTNNFIRGPIVKKKKKKKKHKLDTAYGNSPKHIYAWEVQKCPSRYTYLPTKLGSIKKYNKGESPFVSFKALTS